MGFDRRSMTRQLSVGIDAKKTSIRLSLIPF